MSPPASPISSPQTNGNRKGSGPGTPLSLDLSSLPPLIQPSPPSNTLLITNLNNQALFQPPSLSKIRALVSSQNPLNSFAPIRSFHRIIISYHDTDAAVQMRQMLDGASTKLLMPQDPDASSADDHSSAQHYDRIRCYFGEPTPITGENQPDQHLKAPNPGKLFFISPPPSPPCGWESKEEDPPNKDTHAEDLERALATLGGQGTATAQKEYREATEIDEKFPATSRETRQESWPQEAKEGGEDLEDRKIGNRGRTKSTTVYHPSHHGSAEHLPAVVVSDMSPTHDEEDDGQDMLEGPKGVVTHTSRPPVELMEE